MDGGNTEDEKWCIGASDMARRTINPIRRIIDTMKLEPNSTYSTISLSIGDPTVFGNLPPHENMLTAVEESLRSSKHNGYALAIGNLPARQTIAKHMSTPDSLLTENDIIITSACSGAIELCIGTLANPGDTILIPKPGFVIYKTIGMSNGCRLKSYNLLPEKGWDVDLEHLESLIDESVKCIIVTNPSNPCGSVYTKEHLTAICKIAERHRLPIIADEIYAYSVFSGETFHPLASCTKVVPILSCCALSKRFLVPGWRCGWIQIHDQNDAFKEVRSGLFDMATRILGANSVIQGAIPKLFETPAEWFEGNMKFIESMADLAYKGFCDIPGLNPVKPRGAMYMMVGIDTSLYTSIRNDVHFTEELMAAKSVFCLPGSAFEAENYFRIVLTVPRKETEEALVRISDFCKDLIQQQNS